MGRIPEIYFCKEIFTRFSQTIYSKFSGITSWQKLKLALEEEFKTIVNSAQIHKQLNARKMKKEESVQEYFLCMKEMTMRGKLENNALIQYVIDGITDLNINKTVLYGASDLRQFKEKLKVYETIRENSKPNKEVKSFENKVAKYENKIIVCYNCGTKGHKSAECKDKAKGTKCFQCKKFGHISKDCPETENKNEKTNTRRLCVKSSIVVVLVVRTHPLFRRCSGSNPGRSLIFRIFLYFCHN
uniref:Gag-Pol polyprotein n=1 Tax=Zeugodacus cucurbitae TaxID=28588 RepID=A0A0A1WYW1_ZEUCU